MVHANHEGTCMIEKKSIKFIADQSATS